MKKTQAQLKADFRKELENTSSWRNDPHMQDYIEKEANYIVELHDGGIMYIEKPKIETRFCFGYSLSQYDSESYDRANEMENEAMTNENYFLQQNLEDLERTEEELKKAIESENLRNTKCQNYYILKHHRTGDTNECKIRSYSICDKWDLEEEKRRLARFENELEEMTKEALENWLEGIQTVKAQFTKRLNTYLKRYGLTKLHTRTYWADA